MSSSAIVRAEPPPEVTEYRQIALSARLSNCYNMIIYCSAITGQSSLTPYYES